MLLLSLPIVFRDPRQCVGHGESSRGDKGKDKARGAADSRGGLGAEGKHPAPLWLSGEQSPRAGFILLVCLILLSVRLSLRIKDELPSWWNMMLSPKPLAAVKSSLAYGEIRLSLLKEENNDVSGDGNGAVMDFIVFKSDFICNKWTGFLARGASCTKLQCGHFI